MIQFSVKIVKDKNSLKKKNYHLILHCLAICVTMLTIFVVVQWSSLLPSAIIPRSYRCSRNKAVCKSEYWMREQNLKSLDSFLRAARAAAQLALCMFYWVSNKRIQTALEILATVQIVTLLASSNVQWIPEMNLIQIDSSL